jgi:hypothetical protein
MVFYTPDMESAKRSFSMSKPGFSMSKSHFSMSSSSFSISKSHFSISKSLISISKSFISMSKTPFLTSKTPFFMLQKCLLLFYKEIMLSVLPHEFVFLRFTNANSHLPFALPSVCLASGPIWQADHTLFFENILRYFYPLNFRHAIPG